MAKYVSSSGGSGSFAKFQTIGEKHDGVLVGIRQLPNKFKANEPDFVADFKRADGAAFSVRLTQKALIDAWFSAKPVVGERVVLTFEKTYPTNFGNPGKDISVDMVDRASGAPAAAPATSAPTAPVAASEYDQLALRLTGKLGHAAAGPVIVALAQIFSDPAERLAQLQKAVAQHGA